MNCKISRLVPVFIIIASLGISPSALARESGRLPAGAPFQGDGVVGTWVGYINGQEYELELRSDGTLTFSGTEGSFDGTYSVRPGQLLVTLVGEQGVYGLRVSGDTMWLTGADIGGTVEFTRRSTGRQRGPFSSGQSTPGWEDDEQETVQDQSLVGTWSGTIEGREWEVVFKEDGAVTLNGIKGNYTFDGELLSVTVGNDSGTYEVQLTDDTMRISGGDLESAVQLTRKRSESSGGLFSVPRRDTGSQRQERRQGGSSLERQVVGTWVATINAQEFTMVLEEDGSMSFAGNNWTYSVEPGKLIVNTGAASVTYNLQVSGDEMTLSGGDIDGTITFARSTEDEW